MSLINKIIGKEPLNSEPISKPEQKRYQGKIIGIVDGDNGGFGFIASPEIPYRRIFFHWTALLPDTLTFDKLEEGMKVEFHAENLPDIVDYKTGEKKVRGWRALRVKVIE